MNRVSLNLVQRRPSIRRSGARTWWGTSACGAILLALALGASPVAAEKSSPTQDVKGAETVGERHGNAVPPKDHTGVKLKGMTFLSSENGVSEVIVRAAEAYIDSEKNVVFLKEMHVTTASAGGGEVEFEMRCDEGELDLETNDFTARGNVRGHTEDGRRFRTEWARYEEARALVFTDAPVELTEQGGTLRGGGFEYWVADGRLHLTGGASMIQGGD